MTKKEFVKAKAEVIRFEKADIITTSQNYITGSGAAVIDEGDDNE